jgi:hypothetical protein
MGRFVLAPLRRLDGVFAILLAGTISALTVGLVISTWINNDSPNSCWHYFHQLWKNPFITCNPKQKKFMMCSIYYIVESGKSRSCSESIYLILTLQAKQQDWLSNISSDRVGRFVRRWFPDFFRDARRFWAATICSKTLTKKLSCNRHKCIRTKNVLHRF